MFASLYPLWYHWSFFFLQKTIEIFIKQFTYFRLSEFGSLGLMTWESLFFIFLEFLSFSLNISLFGYPLRHFSMGSCRTDNRTVSIPSASHKEITNCCLSNICPRKRETLHLKPITITKTSPVTVRCLEVNEWEEERWHRKGRSREPKLNNWKEGE